MDTPTKKLQTVTCAASFLTLKITENGLSSDYKESDEYNVAEFRGDVFAYTGGRAYIHAGLIGISDAGIIIAFRGTNGIVDLINDCRAGLVSFPYGQGNVHKGFLEAVESIKAGIINKLKELINNNPDLNIYVTGHSKGGAMATLTGLIIARELSGFKVQVLTFGSPRVGDKKFSDNYNISLFRYESFLDCIPHIPFSTQEKELLPRLGKVSDILGKLVDLTTLPAYAHAGKRIGFKKLCREYEKFLKIPIEAENDSKETLNSFEASIKMAFKHPDSIKECHESHYFPKIRRMVLSNFTDHIWVKKKLGGEFQDTDWSFPDTVQPGEVKKVYVILLNELIKGLHSEIILAQYELKNTSSTFCVTGKTSDYGTNFDFTVKVDKMKTFTDNNSFVLDKRNMLIEFTLLQLGEHFVDYRTFDSSHFIHKFMIRKIEQGLTLKEMCMLGSHDAGMYILNGGTIKALEHNTLTQSKSIHEQLNCGARYFDIRPVIGNGGKYLTGHYTDKHQRTLPFIMDINYE